MKEISLHILDITQNSIVAGASKIVLEVIEDTKEDILRFTIKDNGCGMDEEFLKNVINPFTTKRTTRKVGLGIPLLKLAAENAGGGIDIKSRVGEGTEISAWFKHSHIDRQPLGNMADTMFTLITSNTEPDFDYIHKYNDKEFKVSTREIKEILGDVPLNNIEVSGWLADFLKEGESELYEIS